MSFRVNWIMVLFLLLKWAFAWSGRRDGLLDGWNWLRGGNRPFKDVKRACANQRPDDERNKIGRQVRHGTRNDRREDPSVGNEELDAADHRNRTCHRRADHNRRDDP